MIFTGRAGAEPSQHHAGYVAGCYRDGARSDTWTDIARCARGTFVRFVPACTCGWYGRPRPATPAGFRECQRDLVAEHLGALARPRVPRPSRAGAGAQAGDAGPVTRVG